MLTLLTLTPVWLSFSILFFLCIGILPVGRMFFEGMPYNIALSSAYGDVALIACVMIGIGVLQREGVPTWLSQLQLPISAVSIGAAIFDAMVIAGGVRRNTVMDNYHNFVVVALLVYLVPFTSLPLVWADGTRAEKYGAVILCLVFALTLVYDIVTGRVHQLEWLRNNSVTQV